VAKGLRAAEAIKANPNKSSRAIAEELGIGRRTVDRAREAGGSHDASERFRQNVISSRSDSALGGSRVACLTAGDPKSFPHSV
jgi:hypothetical protein